MRFTHLLSAFAISLLTISVTTSAIATTPGHLVPPPVGRPAATATTSAVFASSTELTEFNRLINFTDARYLLRRSAKTYTVFAPTREAIEQVPAHIRERLFVNGHSGLRHLIRSHMVAGTVDLTQLAHGAEIKTLDGEVMRVARNADGSILLNGVYRVSAGQATANGMVYTIDHMIAPAK